MIRTTHLLTAILLAGTAFAQEQPDTPPMPAPVEPEIVPVGIPGPVAAPTASGSLLASPQAAAMAASRDTAPHALRSVSMFAIAPAEARIFHEHDLVQIIVRESSSGRSSAELETKKESDFDGAVTAWPDFQHLLQLSLEAGGTTELPAVGLAFEREYKGEGDYARRDDFSARLSAEVIQILPNGNLILESRTLMKQDEEQFVLKVTGICRPDDVTPANTVLSNQLHDLKVEKVNYGALREASEKGILTKLLDALFAF